MREILFRGKRTDDGEWVEGYYSYSPEIDKHMITTADLAHPFGTNFGFYKVIPETVSQFTGLTDKNGRKVFEGDIVKIVDTFNGIIRGVVCWCNGAFWADCTPTYGEYCFYGIDYLPVEIIGNIYDNPELLKGGNDNG